MKNNEQLDEMRRRIQESLTQAKRNELLDEKIDDLRGGWMSVFTPSTPEHDVQMWVEDFVLDLLLFFEA